MLIDDDIWRVVPCIVRTVIRTSKSPAYKASLFMTRTISQPNLVKITTTHNNTMAYTTRNAISCFAQTNGDSVATQIHKIHKLNLKFRQACSQLVMLNNTIEEVEVRYNRALTENHKSYRYTLRLRLVTVEAVRDQFYKYANNMADILHELQLRLYNQHGVIWSPSLSVEMMDDSD